MEYAWVVQKYQWYKKLLSASQTGIKSWKCEIHVAEVDCLFQYNLSRTLHKDLNRPLDLPSYKGLMEIMGFINLRFMNYCSVP